jgi:hypothetical protein
MKNSILILIFLAQGFYGSAQAPFSYDWHQNIPTVHPYITPYYEFSETKGDTLYVLGRSVTDSLDADPTMATDWIYDEGVGTYSNIVVLSKYLVSTGAYIESHKLIEFPSYISSVNIRDFTLDINGNFIVVGSTSTGVDFDPTLNSQGWYSTITSGDFIAFYNTDGSYNAHIEYASSTGGFDVSSVNVDENNNLYLSGRLTGTMDLDFTANTQLHTSLGGTDAAIVKVDLDSQTYEWSATFGGTSDDDLQYTTLSNNNIVLYGFTASSTIDLDPSGTTDNHAQPGIDDYTFLNILDENGSQVNGIINNAYYGYGITSDEIGNIFLLGEADQFSIVDVDPSISTHYLNTDEYGYYVAKYDSALNFSWARSLTGSPSCNTITASSSYVSVSGSNNGTFLLSNETVVDTLSTPIAQELFITTLHNNSGNLIEHISLPIDYSSGGAGNIFTQALTDNGDLITAGYFKKEIDFNPFDGSVNNDTTAAYSGTYENNPFILKLSFNGFVGVDEVSADEIQMVLYPNPTNHTINIQSETTIQEFSILDMNGRVVLNQIVNAKQVSDVDISELNRGVYLIKLMDVNGELDVKKIIKK